MIKLLKQQFKTYNPSEKVTFSLLMLLFMFPFFKENIHSFLIILLGITTIYSMWCKRFISFDKNLLFFLLPFIAVIIDVALRGQSFEPISKVLFFLFFPFIFSNISTHLFSDNNLILFTRALQVSTLLVCCSYIIQFFIDFDFADLFTYHYNVPKFRHYIYSEMRFFKIHPTYLTAILTFCVVISMQKLRSKYFLVEVTLILFFVVFSIFLMTKLNLIFQLMVVVFFLIFKTGLDFKKRLIVIFTLVLSLGMVVTFVPNVLDRFSEIEKSLHKSPQGLAFDSTNIRVAIYACDLELVKSNYLIGVGFDNLQDSLNKCFTANYDSEFYKTQNYLSHNYFLYMLISSGIIGFALFLFFLFRLLLLTFKINKFLLFVLVCNVIVMCFIEDFFYRQFGLFSFLLLFFVHYKNYLHNKFIKLDKIN